MDRYDSLWLLIIILLEATALYNIKYASENSKSYLLISIVCYALIPYCLYKIVSRGQGIAITNIVWNIASSLYGLFIGIVLFSEVLTLKQKIGIGFGLLGVWFMVLGQKSDT